MEPEIILYDEPTTGLDPIRSDAINEAWLVHGDPHRLNTYLAEVLALTPDDLRAAAAKWLAPEGAHRLLYRAEAPR